MFCPNCGKSLPDGAKFCSGCGTRLDSLYAEPAPAPKRAKKRRVWPIILAVVLLAAAVGGFLAYRHYVVKPREATDDLIRCLKKSDAYESAEDFRSRVDDGHYNYFDAVKSDYGKAELADYFDDLFRDEDYHEYVHDASVLIASGYLNSYDYTADQYIKDSALQRLWEMGSAISPDDVSRITDDSYADDQSGVYFRGDSLQVDVFPNRERLLISVGNVLLQHRNVLMPPRREYRLPAAPFHKVTVCCAELRFGREREQ